mgnify:CR=1 FL=1
MPALDILTIPVGQLATQCYLVSLPDRDDCIVIDPGAEPERIRAALQKKRLAAILLTHGHFDHIGAVSALMDADRPLYIHTLDAPMLTDPKLNLCRMIGQTITAPPANHLLQEGDLVQAAGITLVKAEPQRDVVQVSCKRALEQRRAHCAQALTAVKVQNACGHNPLFRLKDGAKQLVFVHRLEQIVHNAVADGVVRIVKIRMGGQQNEFASKALLPCCADQFDAAQARHADVQKDDVGVMPGQIIQNALAIFKITSQFQLEPDVINNL